MNKWKGLLFGAIAAATYGMNPLFTLPLYQEGLNADSVLFYRYSLAVAMMAVWMKYRRISFKLTGREFAGTVLGGLVFAASSLFLFISYNKMDAGIASTLLFVYPLMVAGIMAAFFREKITPVTIFSLLLALTGIGLLYKTSDGTWLSLSGVILAMLSALSYAIYIVGVNRSGLKSLPVAKLTFYILLFGLSLFVIRLNFGVDLQWIPSWKACTNIVSIAFLPTVVSLACTTLAIHHLGATPTAILGALEPVTAIFFGVVVFGERLSPRMVLGVFLILAAVMLIIGGKTMLQKCNAIFHRK